MAGVFPDRPQAERAVRALFRIGVPSDQVAIVMHDHRPETPRDRLVNSLAPEGIVLGLTAGGLVGSLVGIATLVGPVLGPALASTVVGAVAGALIGGLLGVRRPKEEARHFETGYKSGQVMLSVEGGAESDQIAAVLRQFGADLDHGRQAISGEELPASGSLAVER